MFMVKPEMFTTCLPRNAYHDAQVDNMTNRENTVALQALAYSLALTATGKKAFDVEAS